MYLVADQRNFIVVELENSVMGPCVSEVSTAVNGEELEVFLRIIPEGLDVEPEVLNKTLLLARFRISRELGRAVTGAANAFERSDFVSFPAW